MSELRTLRSSNASHFVWSLAGSDTELAAALEELAAGRFVAASDLMRNSRSAGVSSDLRSYRLLLMAQSAAHSGAADRWTAERPREGDAWALLARVAVLLAVRAHQQGDAQLDQLVAAAQEACDWAAKVAPEDPVPWLARLHLAASIPVDQDPVTGKLRYENRRVLFAGVCQRHPLSREGHYRYLASAGLEAENPMAQMIQVVQDVMPQVPDGSVLHLLPVLAYLTSFRNKAAGSWRDRLVAADREWSTHAAKLAIQDAYQNWFSSARRHREVLLPDLHLLAHALWRADLFAEAGQVFAEIGPWALPVPWSEHGDPKKILLYARNRCRKPPD